MIPPEIEQRLAELDHTSVLAQEVRVSLAGDPQHVVLGKRNDGTYSTWFTTLSDGAAIFAWGHYDMDRHEAFEDYALRVKRGW